jgi:hypothetical protein
MLSAGTSKASPRDGLPIPFEDPEPRGSIIKETVAVAIEHSDKQVLISVPYHNKDLKRGTLGAILRQAGITTEELRKLL